MRAGCRRSKPPSAQGGRGCEVALDGELDQAYQVVNFKFTHEAGPVGVDGLRADFEQIGNILGAESVDEMREDLHFPDRKSTRLNSSHRCISYAVFCLKKKTPNQPLWQRTPSDVPPTA